MADGEEAPRTRRPEMQARRVPAGTWGVLLCTVLCLSLGPAGAEDWRCPLWVPTGDGSGSTSTPSVDSAAGCETRFTVIAKLTVAPDVDQVIMPVKPPGATVELVTTSTIVGTLPTQVKTSEVLATFSWRPQLADARNEDYVLTFEGPANLNCTIYQFRVKVEKCKYCIQERDSFHTIAAEFNSHWSQIWSSNPELKSPDSLQLGTKIMLGNLFRTRFGDTWKSIAVRFGTVVEMIERLNPEIDFSVVTGSDIPAGTMVCVMPETCPTRRTAFPGITW
uniref:LysM domain-containing protein n=1 Tax=Hemiselmis andersenii TaxID=464988 RepID=A0A6U4VZJ6_HEMAN|mmetsp:Transcript_33433/g.78362  ORF Transcript_33433/g.78362 Transcript_33433/m.78362 type:complete len:278 (+) Transcript_33433:23-856(+)